ncbi:MAG: hypothetical protein Q6373_021350 [Candidatus Sigynarchaeota archaeon]
MNQKDKINIYKAVPLLFAFTFALILFVFFFCVKETISALPLFASYIDAGNSVFLPFIPRVNLLFFLPESAQVLPFTIGHLIDFIIIVNLIVVVNPVAYPYYKKISNEYQYNQFYDLYVGYSHSLQKEPQILLDIDPMILVNRQCVFDDLKELESGHVSMQPGTIDEQLVHHDATDKHAVRFVEPPGSRQLQSTICFHPAPDVPRSSSLHRTRAIFLGYGRNGTRSRVARAVFTLLFSLIPIFCSRHR